MLMLFFSSQAAQSVNKALEQFVKPEQLDGENSYKCSKYAGVAAGLGRGWGALLASVLSRRTSGLRAPGAGVLSVCLHPCPREGPCPVTGRVCGGPST